MQEENNSAEQAVITHVIQRFVDAWNQHDGKDFGTLFTPNAEWIDVLGHVEQGREEIEHEHIYAFSTVLSQAILTIHEKRIRWIRPDVATVGLSWQSTGNQTPDGLPLPTRYGQATMVLAKEDGRWFIISGQNVDYTAAYRLVDRHKELDSFQQ